METLRRMLTADESDKKAMITNLNKCSDILSTFKWLDKTLVLYELQLKYFHCEANTMEEVATILSNKHLHEYTVQHQEGTDTYIVCGSEYNTPV